jgi:AraC-like DNA-binding protein
MPSLVNIQPMSHESEPGIAPNTSALYVDNPLNCSPPEVSSRRLYGDLQEAGVSIDSYDFRLNADFDWSQTFRPDCLELCLNVSGNGFIQCHEDTVELTPSTVAIYTCGEHKLCASRTQGERHRFITVCFTSAFLRDHLPKCECTLEPIVRQFKLPCMARAGVGRRCPFTNEEKQLISQLFHPLPVAGARRLWYQSIVLQLMAHFFFAKCNGSELGCPRQKQLAKERVDRVIAILHRDLAAPPALKEIGREIGCSPFHLSRIFSKEMGMTIPQCLRKLRMEYAAKLLTSGKYNVTEAAMEVGYSSLGHFSRAFCQAMGCCPAIYSSGTPVQERPTLTELRSEASVDTGIDVFDNRVCCCLDDTSTTSEPDDRN